MVPKVITFGEILLRLSTQRNERLSQASTFDVLFGGGEPNVAASLAGYGIESSFVSRIPNTDIGTLCRMYLNKYGVDTSNMIHGGERLGIYFFETGAVARSSKVVYDRAHSAFSDITPGMFNWKEILKGANWFHWTGIVPAVSQGAADACMEAIITANEMGITVSTDLNYRNNLWKYGKTPIEVMTPMVERCDVINLNEEALATMLGISLDKNAIDGSNVDKNQFIKLSQKVIERFPRIKTIVTTPRGSINASHNSWSGLLFRDGKLYNTPTYDMTHIIDRVGGGDSFMAGLIYGALTYGSDYQKVIDFATAASCLKHTIHGDFNLATVAEVEKLMSGDASGRVAR